MTLACRQLSPKHVVTDILRISGTRPFPVSVLLDIGALFHFSSNAMRVAINRLERHGIVEKAISTTRNTALHYQLCASTNPFSDFIEEWKAGAARTKPWHSQHWIACHLPKKPDRSVRARSFRALGLLGFRPGPDNLWIRPDNLSTAFEALDKQLRHFGLEDQASLMGLHQMHPTLCQEWQTRWLTPDDVETYNTNYPDMIASLKRSQQRLNDLPIKDAMVESFQLGSNTIHWLTKDPLVPEQLLHNQSRDALCQTMLDYDTAGRVIWLDHINTIIQQHGEQPN